MPSIFTRIIDREIPAHIVAEDKDHIAFLDINPLTKGHTLVIPKLEVDYLYDLEDKVLSDLFIFSKRVAAAIEQVVPCSRIGVTVMGLEVPHAHVHLIPMMSMDDMNFSRPKLSLTDVELAATANDISKAFAEQD